MHNQGNKKVTKAQEDFSGGAAALIKTAVKPSANIICVRKRRFLERGEDFLTLPNMVTRRVWQACFRLFY
jgi:hypothetical protein